MARRRQPASATKRSRRRNFCTLPEDVVGSSSTKAQWRGVLYEYRSYVRRRPDPSNGRARLVSLTAKGRRMVRVARRQIAEIEAGWSRNSDVAGLPPELRDGLEAAIERAESHRKVV
jgi:hypothetical protein